MKKWIKKGGLVLVVILILSGAFFVYLDYAQKNSPGFDVDSLLIKSVATSNEKIIDSVTIINFGEFNHFNLYLNGLKNQVYLSENSFSLNPYEKKEVSIVFEGDNPGVYTGSLVINEKKVVPVIFEVQSVYSAYVMNLDVAPEYKIVSPGEKFSAGVKIFSLKNAGDMASSVRATYMIEDLNSNVILSETESIGLTNEGLITKTVVLPKDLEKGNYVFSVVLSSNEAVATSSYLFEVGKKNSSMNLDNELLYILIFAVLVIIIFGIIVIYTNSQRDKLFLELEKHHKQELNLYFKELYKKRNAKIKRQPKKKRKIIRDFNRIKRKHVKTIKQRHKDQKASFKKLKKDNKTNEMKRMLDQWKKEGFNVGEFEIIASNTKKVTKDDVKRWKKEGYRM